MRIFKAHEFQRVLPLDTCFVLVDLVAQSDESYGISEISRKFHLHTSTASAKAFDYAHVFEPSTEPRGGRGYVQ